MPPKLSPEDQHFLDTGTELNADPPPADDDDREPIEAAIEEDDEPAPAAPEKPAKAAKGAKDAAKPDAAADAAKTAEKAQAPEGFVEKGALDAERNRRREIERERAREQQEQAAWRARMEERLRLMQEGPPRQQQEPRAEPTIDEPLEYLEHLGRQFGELRQMTVAERRQAEESARVDQAWGQVQQVYAADARRHAEENPDFADAYGFFIGSLRKELGRHPKFRNNPAALERAILMKDLEYADAALAAGESPAEYVFGLAQDRGWAKKQPEPQPQPATAANGNGQQRPKPTSAEAIDRLAAAKDASTSLSSAGGAPGGNKITLEDLDRMTDKQLGEFIKRKNAKDPHGYDNWLRRQMGA